MFEKEYMGISKWINPLVFPLVEFHRAYFFLQVKSACLTNQKLKWSLILSTVVTQIPKVYYSNQPAWTGVSALECATLNTLPAGCAFCKLLLSLLHPAFISAFYSWLVTFPAVAGEQSINFNGSFPSLVSIFCFHPFQVFSNIFSACMNKDKSLRGTGNNSRNVPLNLKARCSRKPFYREGW